jgi:hypothetical protein
VSIDHHTIAAVSIAGTFFDVLGSLYLAYDLLGGRHGPLRLLTRAVTYSVVFGVGYGIGLGLFFGLAAGLRPVSRSRLNSIEHLVVWNIIPCFGKDCSAPFADLPSVLDSTGF